MRLAQIGILIKHNRDLLVIFSEFYCQTPVLFIITDENVSKADDVVIWFQHSVKIVILINLIHSLNKCLNGILRPTNIYKYNF